MSKRERIIGKAFRKLKADREDAQRRRHSGEEVRSGLIEERREETQAFVDSVSDRGKRKKTVHS